MKLCIGGSYFIHELKCAMKSCTGNSLIGRYNAGTRTTCSLDQTQYPQEDESLSKKLMKLRTDVSLVGGQKSQQIFFNIFLRVKSPSVLSHSY